MKNDDELYDEFLMHMHDQDKTKKTIQNYGSCIRDFKKWLHEQGNKFADVQGHLGVDILITYLRYLKEKEIGQTGKTITFARIKIYFSALNCFYNWMNVITKLIEKNVVLEVRSIMLKTYKNGYKPATRQFLKIEEMSRFLNGIFALQDKTINVVFVKTGIRKNELRFIDVDDVDLSKRTITLKDKFHKRTNNTVVFDMECKRIIELWLERRKSQAKNGEKALFLGEYGKRINHNRVYTAVTSWAARMGYHNPDGRTDQKFTPHCHRHCFTHYLTEAGMPEHYIEYLRGDAPTRSIKIYQHPQLEKIRNSYDKSMPAFGL